MTLEDNVREILRALGEDPEREGLLRTPDRVARAFKFLAKGYDEDPAAILNSALFTEEYSEMIVLKDLDFFSLCEHHLLPFFGKAHVAYIPNHRILGLSKIARLFEVFARRLQVQERLTTQVANSIMDAITNAVCQNSTVLIFSHSVGRTCGCRSRLLVNETG